MNNILKPALNQGTLIKTLQDVGTSLDNHTITFSFEYTQKKHGFEFLERKEKAAVASSLFKRREMTWREIRLADRHGLGIEIISKTALKTKIPHISLITPDTVFHAMRFDGKKPMVGFRVARVFYLLWFDRDYTLYDHGS